ncbi:CHC2 zinc finger domain-containing protein [Lacrimispora sp. BS-2]|uniref:CHC2 zinc finger domain-containing protein n=1 Tax=Lacrimispora sp. BS-2 TaxID=3151850 RepID=A0AAU7PQJ4_9FIRM
MREFHSCDPELFHKVKESVSMQAVAEYYGLQVNKKGLCLCPFHQDKDPSMKIYPNGKGFYCFTCGTGGDQIKFAALYQGIRNEEAAKELAAAFSVPVTVPVTYREKREAERKRKRRQNVAAFAKRAKMYVQMYRILLCEAIHEKNEHFTEALQNITYIEYLLENLEECPEEVYGDKKAVIRIGEIEGRINNWYVRTEPDGSISR